MIQEKEYTSNSKIEKKLNSLPPTVVRWGNLMIIILLITSFLFLNQIEIISKQKSSFSLILTKRHYTDSNKVYALSIENEISIPPKQRIEIYFQNQAESENKIILSKVDTCIDLGYNRILFLDSLSTILGTNRLNLKTQLTGYFLYSHKKSSLWDVVKKHFGLFKKTNQSHSTNQY